MFIHWTGIALYFFVSLGIGLTVSWKHVGLAQIFGGGVSNAEVSQNGTLASPSTTSTTTIGIPNTTSPTIIAIYGWNPNLAGFVNGCLIFVVLSAGNTALYYASRTLYGLTRQLREQQSDHRISRWLGSLSVLHPLSRTPARAIGFTIVAFIWLPMLADSTLVNHRPGKPMPRFASLPW